MNRKRRHVAMILFCAVLLLHSRLPAGAQVDLSADLEQIRATHKMPGISAKAVKDGRIIAQGAAGVMRQGFTNRLTVDAPINIASCTKWMTATVAGRLVDRGVLNWNTKVRDLLTNHSQFNTNYPDATLEQLLAHRAGVQQGVTFESRYWTALQAQSGTVRQIRRWVTDTVLKDAPEVTPGTYLYSNQGYAVAASMMEEASGKDWETLMAEEVFKPLRLKTARMGIVYGDAVPPAAIVGHDLGSGQTVPVPRSAMNAQTLHRYQAANAPGGFVICTMVEWARFLHAHVAGESSGYLSTNTATRLQRPFTGAEGYGLGISAVNRSWATPGQALTHAGDIFGHDTVIWLAPAKNLAIMVFVNCRSADNSTASALDAAASLLVGRYNNAVASGPAIDRPEFSSVRIYEDTFIAEFASLPGMQYVTEMSSALFEWAPVQGTPSVLASGYFSRTTNTELETNQFFRMKVFP